LIATLKWGELPKEARTDDSMSIGRRSRFPFASENSDEMSAPRQPAAIVSFFRKQTFCDGVHHEIGRPRWLCVGHCIGHSVRIERTARIDSLLPEALRFDDDG
jgi:hypothetical protein